MCLWLLSQCSEMWVFGDYINSTGCLGEIAYCKNHGIPYKTMPDRKCFKQNVNEDCLDCVFIDDDDGGLYCELKNIDLY